MVLLQVLMALFTLTRGMETIQAVVDPKTGNLTILEPPTKNQMVRRVWSDSQGHIWVSEWAREKFGCIFPF